MTLCDPGTVRSHTDARTPRYLEGGLALSSFCPLLRVSSALVSYPLIETQTVHSSFMLRKANIYLCTAATPSSV